MNFIQKEDGSLDIKFSWKERFILFRKGKLTLTQEGLRHFGNVLIRFISDTQDKFSPEIKNKLTKDSSKIEGK